MVEEDALVDHNQADPDDDALPPVGVAAPADLLGHPGGRASAATRPHPGHFTASPRDDPRTQCPTGLAGSPARR
jgi:hypothetical protein